jgi:cytochrome c oxidase subunit 2
MTRFNRPRQLVTAAVAAIVPVLLAACNESFPNSTFQRTTDINRDLIGLWNQLMWWGILVFVIVEAVLVYAMVKYRRRPDSPEPKHVHGNTVLEISWTLLPAVILAIIAVPTVRAIWRYEGQPPQGSLQVEVIGHQWWWEFRYPQYNVTTANELYLPIGRTVNFSLRTADVIHSFWIPGLSGKRDAISNRTNYLWFTPDSVSAAAWIGSCNEYCGASHANMRFRAFTVAQADFESWARHQASPAVFPVAAPAAPGGAAAAPSGDGAGAAPVAQAPATPQAGDSAAIQRPADPPVTQGYAFPREQVGAHIIPHTGIPRGLTFPENLAGDATRGLAIYSRSACIGCHKIQGNRMSMGIIGPDLTHVGSRLTLAGGIFPNDTRHLALWIKNSRKMKPGVLMNTQGKGEYDPILKATVSTGGLTDQDIADVVAYLQSLK